MPGLGHLPGPDAAEGGERDEACGRVSAWKHSPFKFSGVGSAVLTWPDCTEPMEALQLPRRMNCACGSLTECASFSRSCHH